MAKGVAVDSVGGRATNLGATDVALDPTSGETNNSSDGHAATWKIIVVACVCAAAIGAVVAAFLLKHRSRRDKRLNGEIEGTGLKATLIEKDDENGYHSMQGSSKLTQRCIPNSMLTAASDLESPLGCTTTPVMK
jgi:hypothetical protein